MISRELIHVTRSISGHHKSTILTTLGNTPKLSRCNTYSSQRFASTNPGDGTSRKEKIEEKIIQEDDIKALAIAKPRQIFEKEFPDYFSDGRFVNRVSYVEFIDKALARLKELGLEKDLNAYKELLQVFPPGKYHPKPWDFGMFHAPQQLCAIRVLHQMELCGVGQDRDVERIVIEAFSKKSSVWVKCARMNYWYMKGRNRDPNPLPENLPEQPHQIARLALLRMLGDFKTTVITKNTSSVPRCIDKTWVVYCQNAEQMSIINKLDEEATLYIEDCGYSYVSGQYLSYYTLKYYVSEEVREKKAMKPEIEFNFNTLKMKFYGKPIQEKLAELEEQHYIDGAYILALGVTGTSSHDSILSWLKMMEQKVPKLSKLKVVFKLDCKTPETSLVTPEARQEASA